MTQLFCHLDPWIKIKILHIKKFDLIVIRVNGGNDVIVFLRDQGRRNPHGGSILRNIPRRSKVFAYGKSFISVPPWRQVLFFDDFNFYGIRD